MRIEALRIRNFKVFRDVEIADIPDFAVFLGMNGVGKTTFFDVFGFLGDCLAQNVRVALSVRGGFSEVVSRGRSGDIEFFIQFRRAEGEPLVAYELSIGLDVESRPIVVREVVRIGFGGGAVEVLDFAGGEGVALVGGVGVAGGVEGAERRRQKLESPDILAVKGLGQFKEFGVVVELRKLIEGWRVSDFRVDGARQRNEVGYCEGLSKTGDNLAAAAKYLYDNHRGIFDGILQKMRERVPGVSDIEAGISDGYVVLRFADGKFKDPFSVRFVSDGTVKMFAYLIMLSDPKPHALLCVEEPENQLYPKLLSVLAEEFRAYTGSGGQVFISTHSPEFLNAVELSELFCLVKRDGFTEILRASDSPIVSSLYSEGDSLGDLWSQELLFEGGFGR